MAKVIGVRPNAIAIDVPSVTRSVTSAACTSWRNGSCMVSPVQRPAYPAASLAAADVRMSSKPPSMPSMSNSGPLDECFFNEGTPEQGELAVGEAVAEHVGLETTVLGVEPGEHLAHGLGVGGHEARCGRTAGALGAL